MDDLLVASTFWDWKIGDMATWFGGIGSAAAAIFAGYAARQAYRVARVPIEEQERQRIELASIIAPALAYELRRAKEELPTLADAAEQAAKNFDHFGFLTALHGGLLRRTTMMSTFLHRLDVFGRVPSAELLKVVAGILNIRESVDGWRALILQREKESSLHIDDLIELETFAATCRRVCGKIDQASDMLTGYSKRSD